MYGYERSYKTGRAVTSWLEFVGWVIVVLGVIVALAGFASGGFMGMASRNFSGGNTPFILRIVSMVPGFLIAASGLVSIMLAQHSKATIDTSEMTRELLDIARKGANSAPHSQKAGHPDNAQLTKIPVSSREVEEVVNGVEIVKFKQGFRVRGMEFETLEKAKVYAESCDRVDF